MARPPFDGQLLPIGLKSRQHEVQAVNGPSDRLAIAWTDDKGQSGTSGWMCGYAASDDGGRSWSSPLYHKRPDFSATGNPTVAVGANGEVYAVAMSVQDDYSSGVLELSASGNTGRTWSPWTPVLKKHDGIPDRPKLAVTVAGDLHLIFSAVEPTGRNLKQLRSTVRAIQSTDRGRTWSKPRTISPGQHRSRWFIDGYQGPAIAVTGNQRLLLSWADYYGSHLYFSASQDSGITFDKPVSVKLQTFPGTGVLSRMVGASFGTPATELAVDLTEQNMVISVHEGHAMSHILPAGSQDGGRTWSRIARLTQCGTNAALQFDPAGRLHVIWTEMSGRHIDTRYAISADFGQTFCPAISLAHNGAQVTLPASLRDRDEFAASVGSYQSLVFREDGVLVAFWIDFRDGLTAPKLYHTSWRP